MTESDFSWTLVPLLSNSSKEQPLNVVKYADIWGQRGQLYYIKLNCESESLYLFTHVDNLAVLLTKAEGFNT